MQIVVVYHKLSHALDIFVVLNAWLLAGFCPFLVIKSLQFVNNLNLHNNCVNVGGVKSKVWSKEDLVFGVLGVLELLGLLDVLGVHRVRDDHWSHQNRNWGKLVRCEFAQIYQRARSTLYSVCQETKQSKLLFFLLLMKS